MALKKNQYKNFIFLLIFLIIALVVVSNALSAVDLDKANSEINGNLESAKKTIDTGKELASGNEKWDYLMSEWKKIFLSNPVVSAVNTFLNKISLVFRVFIGIDYSFSFMFFFSLFLWFYLLYNINYMLKFIKMFKGFVSFAISLLIVMLLGQFNFYAKTYHETVILIKNAYGLVSFIPYAVFLIICFFAILIILFGSENVFAIVRSYFDKRYRTFEKQIEQNDKALFHMIVNKLSDIFTKNPEEPIE